MLIKHLTLGWALHLMRNLLKILIATFIYPSSRIQTLASDIYFVDYSKVMNESGWKKAQDVQKSLKAQIKFNETAKKLKEEKNK